MVGNGNLFRPKWRVGGREPANPCYESAASIFDLDSNLSALIVPSSLGVDVRTFIRRSHPIMGSTYDSYLIGGQVEMTKTRYRNIKSNIIVTKLLHMAKSWCIYVYAHFGGNFHTGHSSLKPLFGLADDLFQGQGGNV